jgi:hypothetical protein
MNRKDFIKGANWLPLSLVQIYFKLAATVIHTTALILRVFLLWVQPVSFLLLTYGARPNKGACIKGIVGPDS